MAKWGIWCLPTEGWCYDGDDWATTVCLFPKRSEATRAMNEMTMTHTRKDYEVRKYKETA